MSAVRAARVLGCAFVVALAAIPCASAGDPESGGVHWFAGTLEQALVRAKAEKKIVVLDAWARWCGPCHAMDREVWSREDLARTLEREAVPIKAEVDRAAGIGNAIGTRYAIQALPNILFLAPDGEILERIEGARPASAILETLDRAATRATGAESIDAAGDDPARLVRVALRLARGGKAKDARAAAERAITLDADCAKDEADDASLVLADVAQQAGRPGDALGALERGAARCPKASGTHEIWDRLVALAEKSGDPARKIATLKRRIASFDHDADAQLALATALADRREELDVAERAANRAIELEPDDPAPLAVLARVRVAQKRYADARAVVDRAIRIDPNDPALRELRLEILRLAGP